jgi:hypothetical protein
MIVQLSLPIFKLDQDAISFLCLATQSLDRIVPQFQTLIGGFPTSIFSMTEERPPKNEAMAAECVTIPEVLPKLECKMIEPGLEISHDAAVEGIEVDEQDLSAFLPEIFVASGATTLPNFMKGMKSEYMDCFFGVFERHLKQAECSIYYIDFYSIFLYFAWNNDYAGLCTTHIGLWLSPVIFNPRFTVFDYIPSSIQSLRALTFNIASDDIWMEILCYTASFSAYVFAEQCLRVLNEASKTRLCKLTSSRFLRSLLSSSRYLQDVWSKERTEKSRRARMSCFDMMFELIENSNTNEEVFGFDSFAEGYLSFIFERGLEEVILEKLRKGFVQSSGSNFSNLIPLLCRILDTCGRYPNNDNYQRIADLTFHCVLTSLRNRPKLIEAFNQLFPPFLNYIVAVPKSERFQGCFTFLLCASRSIHSSDFRWRCFDYLRT